MTMADASNGREFKSPDHSQQKHPHDSSMRYTQEQKKSDGDEA